MESIDLTVFVWVRILLIIKLKVSIRIKYTFKIIEKYWLIVFL